MKDALKDAVRLSQIRDNINIFTNVSYKLEVAMIRKMTERGAEEQVASQTHKPLRTAGDVFETQMSWRARTKRFGHAESVR